MYAKLKIKHNLTSYTEANKVIDYGYYKGGKFYGYTSYTITDDIAKNLFSIIPEEYRAGFDASLLVITNGRLEPHTDQQILASINFYVDGANGITEFWRVKDGVNPRLRSLKSGTKTIDDAKEFYTIETLPNKSRNPQDDGFIYHVDDIEKVCEFKAEPMDIYVLNVKEIHSVVADEDKVRVVYALKSFKYTYEEVLRILTKRNIEHLYEEPQHVME